MNMFISNLGFKTNDEDLRKLFEPFGQVISAKVITDRVTGTSRGFGFVAMNSSTEAGDAMVKLTGQEIEGRTITVTEAKPKEDKTGKRSW